MQQCIWEVEGTRVGSVEVKPGDCPLGRSVLLSQLTQRVSETYCHMNGLGSRTSDSSKLPHLVTEKAEVIVYSQSVVG